MAIEKYNTLTGIKNVQIGDYDWIENLFADYVTPGATGYTEGLLCALQLFFTLYLNDPRNLYSGLNISGGTSDVYKVRYSAGDLEGYFGDKIKSDDLSGITLTVDGTSNKIMKIALNLQESSSTSTISLLSDSKTLKKFKSGTGINIISTSTELEISIDEAWLEGITYGIKYSWDNEAEMLAEIGMNDADLGVRNDLGEVWKYNTDTWEYFFELGTSTTEHTTVSSVPTESFSGSKTSQQGVNEETVSELGNIYNILEGNSPAFGDLRGAGGSSPDDLPIVPSQAVPLTETVATWTTLKQSSNEDTWEFNDTLNEILIKKAGFYTWNTQIELTNNSSQTRFLVFSSRNKNDNTEVFYTREISVSRDGVTTQSSITFEVPNDDTTMEITIHGHDSAGNVNDDLTITNWNTSLLLNFVLNPIATGSGQFPLQWVYEDFGGVDGKFNINNTGIKISKNMFSDEAQTTFVDTSVILSELQAGNSIVLVDEDGNKGLFTFNVDLTDEGTFFQCDNYTETGVFLHNIDQIYNFQFIGLASSGETGTGDKGLLAYEYNDIDTNPSTGEIVWNSIQGGGFNIKVSKFNRYDITNEMIMLNTIVVGSYVYFWDILDPLNVIEMEVSSIIDETDYWTFEGLTVSGGLTGTRGDNYLFDFKNPSIEGVNDHTLLTNIGTHTHDELETLISGNTNNITTLDTRITSNETLLDDKVNTSQVLTDVPINALFTDTVYTLPDDVVVDSDLTNYLKAVGETRDISTTGGGSFGGDLDLNGNNIIDVDTINPDGETTTFGGDLLISKNIDTATGEENLLTLETIRSDNPKFGNSVGIDFRLNNNNNNSSSFGKITISNENYASDSKMRFFTKESNVLNERMTLDKSGNLAVVGDGTFGGDLDLNGNNIIDVGTINPDGETTTFGGTITGSPAILGTEMTQLQQVESLLGDYLPLSGTTIIGDDFALRTSNLITVMRSLSDSLILGEEGASSIQIKNSEESTGAGILIRTNGELSFVDSFPTTTQLNGVVYTQTASQLGGSGTQKVLCIG